MLKRITITLLLASVSFAVTVPRPAGEVAFTIPGKGPDKLSNYRGKVVLLAFFLTTCPHCQQTTTLLTGIQRDFKAKGLQVIELAFRDDDDEAAIKNFVAKYKTNFPVGKIDAEVMAAFAQLTAEMRPTVPILVVVDRTGVVRAQYLSTDPMMEDQYQDQNLRAKLMQYLGPRGAAVKK